MGLYIELRLRPVGMGCGASLITLYKYVQNHLSAFFLFALVHIVYSISISNPCLAGTLDLPYVLNISISG